MGNKLNTSPEEDSSLKEGHSNRARMGVDVDICGSIIVVVFKSGGISNNANVLPKGRG